ncbi:hypothetical protein PAP_10075 [Palaeococcus pacificus DY20341]|uniref:Uncharacterized protein n=1 Tax=Palaeococcus pacificus DY20341 TaxID=1343739 RepID=A0A075LVM1_9EURY|nr:hypothetical protein [Palaeococcus pacificus]AIF70389.1 hypothetical protein PAP_10075 [Palaeococcus pacificus DY20341]
MVKKKDTQKIQEIIREAYRFGYFIGYKGHSEWISWVGHKKSEIYEKARELGVYEKAKKAYQRGKLDGERKRMEDVQSGLAVKLSPLDESKSKLKEAFIEEEIQSEGRFNIEFARILNSPSILEPPEILELMGMLKKPKTLGFPSSIGYIQDGDD